MSFVSGQPQALTAAAGTLREIGLAMSAQNAARRPQRRGWFPRLLMRCRR